MTSFAWLTVSLGLLAVDPSPEQRTRDALAAFERTWKPAEDARARPLGDDGWKTHVRALRDVLQAGPAARAVLRPALKSESAATRAFAAQALALLDAPVVVQRAMLNASLTRLDSARLEQRAPLFTLIAQDDEAVSLCQYRGEKAVLLLFLLEQR